MKTKTAPRARLYASTSLFPMLRGPNVFYAPDEDPTPEPEADPTPEEFREQPGDREPEEAEPEPVAEEPEPEAEEEPAEEPEPEAEAEPAEAATEGDPEPPKKDWRDRQIAKLREKEKVRDAEFAEIKRRAEAAEALLAATPEEREAGTGDKDRAEIRKQVAEEVRQEEYFKRLNTGLETMDAAGKKAFAATWDGRIAAAAELFGEELKNRPDMLEAITDLPNAAAVYHELAGDLDKLETVLQMPPHKMGMELARLSAAVAKPPARAVSKVPAPIKPIERGGSERTLEELANDSSPGAMAEFDRRMASEERKRAKVN